MLIAMVAAMGENRVIGNRGDIPWKIPGEQKIFKQLTLGKVLIMGRKTYDSIGRALPGRKTIVVTRQSTLELTDAMVMHSLDAALSLAESIGDEAIIAGGAELYAQALPIAHRIYLTTVRRSFEGDAFFPKLSSDEFSRKSSEEIDAVIPYKFEVYERTNITSQSTSTALPQVI